MSLGLERVVRVLEALGGEPARAPRLLGYLELVSTWNRKMDLTAARTEAELADLMLADTVVLSAHLPERARVVDVGSGAGAPGLPLALLRPDLHLTLVEPLQKRVSFLRTVVGSLVSVPAERPRVLRAKGEEVRDEGQRFQVAVSRATLAPSAWLGLGAPLATDQVWVLLAKEEPPSLPGWAIRLDQRYRWPLTGAERRLVRYEPEALP